MYVLQCYQTTTILPNPELDDSEEQLAELDIKRNLSGGKYHYIRMKGGRRKRTMNFKLTRMKALELREFVRSYYSSLITVIDHLGRCWRAYLTINPFSFTSVNADVIEIPLELEGWTCET